MSGEQYVSVNQPTLRQRQRAGALALLMACGCALALLRADTRVPHSESLVLVIDTARLLLGVVGTMSLFLQYRVGRKPACLALASGFLLISLTTAAQLLRELQGAYIDLRLLLMTDLALPVAMILYVLLRRPSHVPVEPGRGADRPAAVIAATVAFAALVIWTTAASMEPGAGIPAAQASWAWHTFATTLLGVTLAAAIALFWQRRSSSMDLWFLVALGIWLMDVVLRAVAPDDAVATWHIARFYRVLGLGCVVFALLTENVTLFARFERLLWASRSRHGSNEGVIDGIAEEINQPLCAITANADAISRLLDQEQPDLAEVRAALADIVDDAERASGTLRLAQRVVHTHEPPATIDVRQLVHDCVEQLRAELLTQRVTCEVETAAQLPDVRGVRPQLLQLLVNLVTNSVEALSAMQHRERWLRVRAARQGDAVAIWVENSGAGLLPQAQLRLAWCRSIVAAHGGELSAATGEGGGAAFRVLLPANS
jgi:signal transduction histidine kinase